jgi:hypothetical protein
MVQMMFLEAYDGTMFPRSNHQIDRVGECGEGAEAEVGNRQLDLEPHPLTRRVKP